MAITINHTRIWSDQT